MDSCTMSPLGGRSVRRPPARSSDRPEVAVPVRVLLVDDLPQYRAGLRAALDSSPDIAVVGETRTVAEAVRLTTPLRADVVLMDLRPPDTGIPATRASVAPAERPRVLLASIPEDESGVYATYGGAACACPERAARRAGIVRAVWALAEGGAVFGPIVTGRFGAYFAAVHDLPCRIAFPGLTRREREVLDLIARGHDNPQIARRLAVADKTVRNHVSRLFGKLGVGGRAQAAARAREAGLGH